MVACFTVVVEANCIRNQVPCCYLIQEEGKEEETSRNLPLWLFIQLACDTNISHATRVATLWLKQAIFLVCIDPVTYVDGFNIEYFTHIALPAVFCTEIQN